MDNHRRPAEFLRLDVRKASANAIAALGMVAARAAAISGRSAPSCRRANRAGRRGGAGLARRAGRL
ncbi:MAG: hypothetical protein GC203_13460 [Phenylobacterium sp.]|uniref:hypothetical protein n=1 Tax=Phenylobacterium sp. TaxID=1871053 RepID=UPI0025DFDFDE|nr:hypothetical protein [Phenylobacterium sp.]MBI1198863.1 hypothetical protein [Phenylobacterium sp.]